MAPRPGHRTAVAIVMDSYENAVIILEVADDTDEENERLLKIIRNALTLLP